MGRWLCTKMLFKWLWGNCGVASMISCTWDTHTHAQRNELLCGVLWAQTPKLHKALVCPESWAKLGWCCISGNLIIATDAHSQPGRKARTGAQRGKQGARLLKGAGASFPSCIKKPIKHIQHIVFLDFISTLIRIHPNHHKLEHRLSFTTNAQPTPCCYWDCKDHFCILR